MKYYDFESSAPQTCAACGVTAPPSTEYFDQLMQVDCSNCDARLFLVLYPTVEETRAAAAAGNTRAQKQKETDDERLARLDRAEVAALKADSPLPDLPAGDLVIEWDFEKRDGDVKTILRHGTTELWCEYAYWEGYERFEEVARILHDRYGERLKALEPTERSELYLYGDRLSAPQRIGRINRDLQAGKRP